MQVYYLDIDPKGKAYRIAAYSRQFILGMMKRVDVQLNCIWLESIQCNGTVSKAESSVNHYYIPSYHNSNKKKRGMECG